MEATLAHNGNGDLPSEGSAGGTMFRHGSRSKLSPGALGQFSGATLFHRVARVVCLANCLPRKELFESWEFARRIRRRFRGGRVVDLACGHGLVAYLLLLLDDSSRTALAVDAKMPKSAKLLGAAIETEWPRLFGRIEFVQGDVESIDLSSEDLVVSAHGCGALTDTVLSRAIDAGARVAVLPCCQDAAEGDDGGLSGWLESSLAIDVVRAMRLQSAGYEIRTLSIPSDISPKNRLLLGRPITLR